MNKILLVLSFFFIIVFLNGCEVNQEENDRLKKENAELLKIIGGLKLDLDKLKYSEDRIIAIIDSSYKSGDYKTAKENIEKLKTKHPESNKIETYKELLFSILDMEEKIQIKKDVEEKERKRLENLNNMGIWEIRYFTDSFGERTNISYITNSYNIKGTFSNSATTNSDLDVIFIISTAYEFSIKLYEYSRNTEVKGSYKYPIKYKVYIKDDNGKEYSLEAVNSDDRLDFDTRVFHDVLMKSKSVKVYISEYGGRSEYKFSINNTEWYENAYRKLIEK